IVGMRSRSSPRGPRGIDCRSIGTVVRATAARRGSDTWYAASITRSNEQHCGEWTAGIITAVLYFCTRDLMDRKRATMIHRDLFSLSKRTSSSR
ncbi:hypothetical protein ALC62_09625, partial [Cyphomyrmex costatus]